MVVVVRKDGVAPSFFSYIGVVLIFFPFLASYTLILDWINLHDHQRIVTIFSAISFFIVASFKPALSAWVDSFYLKLLVSIVLWLSVISIFSEIPFWSFVELSYISSIFLFSFVIAIFFNDNFFLLLKSAVVFLVSFFLLYYFSLLTGVIYLALTTGKVDAATLVSGYANFRFLNQVQVFLFLFLIFGSCLFERKLQYLIFSILAFTVFILLVTTARGAILSIFLVAATVFLCDRDSRQVFWLFIGSIVVGVVLYLFLVLFLEIVHWLRPELQGDGLRRLKESTSGRAEMWLEALYSAPKYLFFGGGGLHYPLISDLQIGAHPHNILFQFSLEWGYGITGVILIVALSAWRLNSTAIRDFWLAGNSYVYRPFFCSFFGLLIYALFSGVLAMPLSSQSFIFALSGVIHFFRKLSFQTHGESCSPGSFRLRTLVVGVSLLVYWGLMFPQVYGVIEGQKVYSKPYPSLYAPRLWLDGVIR